eukprot:gene10045-2364_t
MNPSSLSATEEIEVVTPLPQQRNVSKFSQKVYNMIAQEETTISIEIENKRKLLQILMWINSIEIIYSFYLDYNTALLILRAVQLYSFSRSRFKYLTHIAYITLVSNLPVFITHAFFHYSSTPIVIIFFQNDPPFQRLLICFVDILVVFLQVLLILTKYELRNERVLQNVEETEDEEETTEDEEEIRDLENPYQ